MRSPSLAQRAGLLLDEEPPVPVELLLLPEPMLLEPVLVPLEPMPLEPVVVLLRGTMPGGQVLVPDRLLVLELELVLLVVPDALEVPAGTQSLEDSELLGLEVEELLLGLLVLPLELVCASAGSAMIRASAVVARICFTHSSQVNRNAVKRRGRTTVLKQKCAMDQPATATASAISGGCGSIQPRPR